MARTPRAKQKLQVERLKKFKDRIDEALWGAEIAFGQRAEGLVDQSEAPGVGQLAGHGRAPYTPPRPSRSRSPIALIAGNRGLAVGDPFARAAVEETGYGVVADKIQKNLFASQKIYNFIRPMKTVGVVNRIEDKKIIEIGEPFGVVLRDDEGARSVGCTARIDDVTERFDDGRMNIIVQGLERFRLLESIRQYAMERLVASGEVDGRPRCSARPARRTRRRWSPTDRPAYTGVSCATKPTLAS